MLNRERLRKMFDYDAAALKHFGEFAYQNEVPS